jgi:hypothetical protein
VAEPGFLLPDSDPGLDDAAHPQAGPLSGLTPAAGSPRGISGIGIGDATGGGDYELALYVPVALLLVVGLQWHVYECGSILFKLAENSP